MLSPTLKQLKLVASNPMQESEPGCPFALVLHFLHHLLAPRLTSIDMQLLFAHIDELIWEESDEIWPTAFHERLLNVDSLSLEVRVLDRDFFTPEYFPERVQAIKNVHEFATHLSDGIGRFRELSLVLPGLFPPLWDTYMLFKKRGIRVMHFEGLVDDVGTRYDNEMQRFMSMMSDKRIGRLKSVTVISYFFLDCADMDEEDKLCDAVIWADFTDAELLWLHRVPSELKDYIPRRRSISDFLPIRGLF